MDEQNNLTSLKQHTVSSYDQDLLGIKNGVFEMGKTVLMQLSQAVQVVCNSLGEDKAAEVIEGDKLVDKMYGVICELVLQILALRQPMAEDLRLVLSSWRIAGDLERVGDYSKSIVKAPTLPFEADILSEYRARVYKIMGVVSDMMSKSLLSYLKKEAIADIEAEEQEVDDLYHEALESLSRIMKLGRITPKQFVSLMVIVKRLERAADLSIHICKEAHFITHASYNS